MGACGGARAGLQAATSQPSGNQHWKGHGPQRRTRTLSLASSEECMVRRRHCTSQCRNHLQTMLAPVLAVEEDLLWRWMENKEQLCKLYGATLWEMPFPFPTGKCAGRRFHRRLGSVTQSGADAVPWHGLRDAQALADSQPLLSGDTADPGCSGRPGEEGSFLGLCVLICLLSFPSPSHVPTLTNIQSVSFDRITFLLRILPRLSLLPSE